MTIEIFQRIDSLINKIDKYKNEKIFLEEIENRKKREIPKNLTNSEILEKFVNLIAFSMSSNSAKVSELISSGSLREVFCDFNIEKVAKLNPVTMVFDGSWDKIKCIRQQSKLMSIIIIANKMIEIGSFNKLLDNKIPKKIKTESDIDDFWKEFKNLKKALVEYKIPFFQNTTSLLHFLLDIGYDCIKPDLKVMKVSKKIGIVEKETGDKNFVLTVRTIQEYSLSRGIKPSVVDFYFLIDEKQKWAIKFVKEDFYK